MLEERRVVREEERKEIRKNDRDDAYDKERQPAQHVDADKVGIKILLLRRRRLIHSVEGKDAKFIDKFGNENKIFQTGDQLTVRIFYKVNEYCENPVFGFAIYSDKDICCYGTNTDLQNYKLDKLKDEGFIDLTFEKIVMMQGKYIITIVVHSVTHEPYDWLDRQFSFNVINKTNEIGLFVIPCSWSMS